MPQCPECGHNGPISDFRYLYNPKIDDSVSLRQCTKCSATLMLDEKTLEVVQSGKHGEARWDKSAGIA